MEEIAVTEFEANCLAALERVRKTRIPVRITRDGEPIAEVAPPAWLERREDWMGSMAGTGEILGDIVAPSTDEDEWDALRDE